MSDFVSLAGELGGYFDKQLDELPDSLRKRVLRDFQMPWGALTPDQRRHQASDWDYQNDPATEQKIASIQHRYRVSERNEQHQEDGQKLLKHKREIEGEILKRKSAGARTFSEEEAQDKKLAEVSQELAEVEKVFARGDYPDIHDKGETPNEPKNPGHLDHDLDWQARANQIAEKQMDSKKRSVTKNAVAKILAEELEEDEGTVLRRTRKEWKFKRQPNCLKMPK